MTNSEQVGQMTERELIRYSMRPSEGGVIYDVDPDGEFVLYKDADAQREAREKAEAKLKDALLQAENYRRVAKVCSLGHEQAEQRAAELAAKLAECRDKMRELERRVEGGFPITGDDWLSVLNLCHRIDAAIERETK